MLSYFTEFEIGAVHGLNTVLLYFIYIVTVAFLLGERPERTRDWLVRLGECAVLWIVMQLVSAAYYAVFSDFYLNQIQQLLATALYALFRCRYPVSKRIVMSCAMWASFSLTISIIGSSGIPFRWGMMLFHGAALLALMLYFRRFAIDEFPLAPRQYLAVVIVLTLAGAVASANWGIMPGVFNPFVFVNDISLLAIVLLVYYLFYRISRTYQRNQEFLALHQKEEAERNAMRLTQSSYEKMRQLRHELKNRDAYIRTLLEQKRYDELETFVQKEHDYLTDSLSLVDCGNQTINTIVNEKIALARASGISIRCELSVPETLPFYEPAMFSLLSNLLDNGIEAAAMSGQENPEVLLRMRQERDYLFIHLENPVDESVSTHVRLRLQTTKRDREAHGYGTKIIRQIAEMYNGHVQYSYKDGQFHSDVMLSMTEGGDDR